jgi:DNA replication protein DnaC
MLETFEQIVKAANNGGALNENDYLGDDGILHCGFCGKPKQKWVHACGKDFFVTFVCECQEQAEKERKKAEAKQRLIADRLADCFGWVKHDAADDEPESQVAKICKDYAQNYGEGAKWLVFHGQCGRGKSYRAAQICREVIQRGYKAKFTTLSAIERQLWDGNKSEVYNSLEKYDILVLDDFGAERSTDFTREIKFNIVDMRYASGKTLIITTNVTNMKGEDKADQRTLSRIKEKCLFVRVDGKDRRAQKAFDNLDESEFETLVEVSK